MKIKGKLVCSFLIITLLPILLLCGAFGVMYQVQVETMEKLDAEEVKVEHIFSNPIQLMNLMTEDVFIEIKQAINVDADVLTNPTYLNLYNDELGWKYSFLIVKKGEDFIYIGNKEKFKGVKEKLPDLENYNLLSETGTFIGGEEAYLVKQHNFTFSDGMEGTFYVVTLANGLLPGLKSIFIQFVISFLVIICFTASLLLVWIYRGMVRPLNDLRKAMHKMRDGDLNFSIHSESEDEIGMLCRDFEEMRYRLKESIEMRLNYEQQMRELVSNISHDLKTPLTAIEGYTEGIIDGVADTPEKQQKYLRTIYGKAKEMVMLVDELSLSAKIENGIIPYDFRHVNVAEYFEDCLQEIRMDLEVQKISIHYENFVEKNIRVQMDPEQMKRVINNIIGNSIKYIEKEEGSICLRITEEKISQKISEKESEGKGKKEEGKENHRIPFNKKEDPQKKSIPFSMVRVEFKDNGIGIASKDLPHIFERFYRTDASRHSTTGGSGLGLAIAKKIVEDHGGRIWAESEKGTGTSIFFTLCMEQDVKKGRIERQKSYE